jgi:hypothetical protein
MTEVSEVECSICGKDGGPQLACPICKGNQRFVQSRSFTLSEERQGKNPNAEDRYGPDGGLGPKIVVLPGGFDPRQGKPQPQE